MTELDTVKGINARQIKLLKENGVGTAEGLAMAGVADIAAIEGLGDKTAQKLIWNARTALGMSDFISACDIDENVEYITTGSSELNRILGGGIATGKLTEIYGPFKSGKTNLGHTVAVTTQLPKSKGGLDGGVVYIDTENTFSKDKIMRIAKRFGLDPEKVLSRLFHARIYSSDHQNQMILKSETLCESRNIRLIIVDSLMALIRNEYQGIGTLARRQGVLNSMIHTLSRIAETHNCAVILTNQVTTKMLGMFSADDAIGGNIVAHGCHFRVMFKTKGFSSNSSLKRKAIIVDAPDLPPEECEFYITSAGVADTEKVDLPEIDAPLKFEKVEIECEISSEKELSDITGLGKGTVSKLKTQGITSIQSLIEQDPEVLAEKTKLSLDKIKVWQEEAKALIT